MPHTPQTAAVRLLQGVTEARNIAPGDRIGIRPQLIALGPRDGLAALKAFRLSGGARVADSSRVVLFVDDNLPAPDAAAAAQRAQLHEAARQAGITRILPLAGCEAAYLIESGLIVPGECAVSGLPEISALGGIGALGLRATARDLAALLAGKPLPVTVPQTVRVDMTGKPQPGVGGFDLFFALRRELGRARLAGCALELTGDLPLHERALFAAQAAHAGLFAPLWLLDRAAVQELNRRNTRPYTTLEPEPSAAYVHRHMLDAAHANMAALPPGGEVPSVPIGEVAGEPAPLVVVRGGLPVLRVAAEMIKARKLAPRVRCLVVPESPEVFAQALRDDLLGYLLDAGVEVHPPGTPAPAGPGVVTGIVAAQGQWRVSAHVAAAAACAGALIHPERLDAQPQRDSKLSARRPSAG